MVQTLATEAQRLHRVVSEALRDRGPCEIAAEKGTLRIRPGERDAVSVEAISASGKPRFSFTLTRSSCELTGALNAEALRERYGSEAEVLRGIRKTIERSLGPHGTGEFDLQRERMPKTPLDVAPPRQGTLERERFDCVATLHQALTKVVTVPNENGKGERQEKKILSIRSFAVDGFLFDIRRNSSDPFAFEMERTPLSGSGEAFIGPRVIVSLEKASGHNRDDRAAVGNERDAIDTLKGWMSDVGLLPKEEGRPGR